MLRGASAGSPVTTWQLRSPSASRSAGARSHARAVPLVDDGEAAPEHIPDAPPNIWALHPLAPAATNAAYRGNPAVIIWHFQLDRR